MKKMFIAAIVACMAVVANAGSVKWETVAMYDSTGAKVKSSATLYIYMLENQAAYDGLTDIWGTYGSDVTSGGAGATASKKTGTTTSKVAIFTPDGTATANTTYYAAVIVATGTGSDLKYYAQKAAVLTGDDGNGSYTLGTGVLNSSTSAIEAWQSASAPVTPPGPGGTDPIPEPTSGLLLIVGGSLLALRRKQK